MEITEGDKTTWIWSEVLQMAVKKKRSLQTVVEGQRTRESHSVQRPKETAKNSLAKAGRNSKMLCAETGLATERSSPSGRLGGTV